MLQTNLRRPGRAGAITASMVFALTLAIVAGLIFAWVFKVVLLDRRAKAVAETPKYRLTVAAVNLLDKTQVLGPHVKTITVEKETLERYEREARERKTELLRDNQPIGRTTVKVINAEEPMFLDQFEPLGYPVSVKERLTPGKRAVIVEVPGKDAMVQVGDVVDVLCTLANDSAVFGSPGAAATAALARNVPVVARFNTTRTAAQPPPNNIRSYTLEVEPWQFAVIELAKTIGASISLAVSANSAPLSGSEVLGAATRTDTEAAAFRVVEARYNAANRVSMADLGVLFGVQPSPPPAGFHRLERYAGNTQKSTLTYPALAPQAPTDRPVTPAVRPAGGSGDTPGRNPSSQSSPGSSPGVAPASDPALSFRPVGAGSKECVNCDSKKR